MAHRNLRHSTPPRLICQAIRQSVAGDPLEPQPNARALERLLVRARRGEL
jgi:transcriptional regulator of met regulon